MHLPVPQVALEGHKGLCSFVCVIIRPWQTSDASLSTSLWTACVQTSIAFGLAHEESTPSPAATRPGGGWFHDLAIQARVGPAVQGFGPAGPITVISSDTLPLALKKEDSRYYNHRVQQARQYEIAAQRSYVPNGQSTKSTNTSREAGPSGKQGGLSVAAFGLCQCSQGMHLHAVTQRQAVLQNRDNRVFAKTDLDKFWGAKRAKAEAGPTAMACQKPRGWPRSSRASMPP